MGSKLCECNLLKSHANFCLHGQLVGKVIFAVRDRVATKDIKAKEAQAIGMKAEGIIDYKGQNSTKAMTVSNSAGHNNCSLSEATVANIHSKAMQQLLTSKQCLPTVLLWLHSFHLKHSHYYLLLFS